MKKIFFLLLLAGQTFMALAQHIHPAPATQQQGTPTLYTCAMHPDVQQPIPGNCPKCGMALVPDQKPLKPQQQTAAASVTKPVAHKPTSPKTVRYDLYVNDTTVNYSGKKKKAIAINGSIPAPTLTFTEGDTAEVVVHNMMDHETSIHWHGVFLPNQYDGVPYLTQMPIKPHSTYLYKFKVKQNGTYWYHSHTALQEQSGMYGALIFNKTDEPEMPAIPVLLSDWTDMHPHEVERFLHTANDWFAIKKGATQSYAEAIGKKHLGTKAGNEWKRMNAMDVSDVYYDKLLANGSETSRHPQFKAGDKVKLRLINGGASTYFWLSWSGGKISVVANDGNDVEAVAVDRLIIAPSETYDVIVTLPEDMQYQFLATAEDRSRSTSIWLGNGMEMPAAPLGKLKYFEGMKMMNGMMKMNGNMAPMGMQMSNQQMDMNTVMYPEITGEEQAGKAKDAMQHNESRHAGHRMQPQSNELVTLNYGMLRATEKTTLPPGPERLLRFELTGNMDRYVWTLDNKTVSESDRILIRKGENVKIILYNNSMMRHPMHLHGHDFRVLNGQGDYAPMKNVLDILPMETDTLEFAATESGDWFFHCHILYHMMSGMGRVFSYEQSPPNPQLPDPVYARRMLNMDDRMIHMMGMAGIETNGSDGQFMIANTRYRLSTEWRLGFKAAHGTESETYFGRYMGRMQWFFPFIGFDYHYNSMNDGLERNMLGQMSNQHNRKALVAGFQYTLPMLLIAEARIDSKGKLRFQLKREDIPITRRLRFNFMANTDKEYMAGFRYVVTKYFSLSTHYDSDMGFGAGITLTY